MTTPCGRWIVRERTEDATIPESSLLEKDGPFQAVSYSKTGAVTPVTQPGDGKLTAEDVWQEEKSLWLEL